MPRFVPLLHPAAILRGRWGEESVQVTYLQRWVRRLKQDPLYLPPDVSKPPPSTYFYPSPQRVREFHQGLLSFGEPCVSVDTEEAGLYLLCVGLTQLDLSTGEVGSTLNIPFRLQGGVLAYPSEDQLREMVVAFGEIMEDPRVAKGFHNGVTHDVPILRHLGFEVEGPLLDTMVLAHLAYPELKKSLQHTATLYCGASHWKSLVDEDDELEGKG